MRVLAIDIGSSSVKAGLWAGRAFVARERAEFRTEFDGVKVEVPAERILGAVRAGRSVMRGAGPVDAVAYCAFSSGVVVAGADGTVRAGVITHQDRRSVVEARGLVDTLGAKWLLERMGNLPYPGGIGTSTLAWLKRHRREVFRRRNFIGQLSSLVGRMLTGEWVIDPSQAVFLGLWDIRKKRWNERVCEAVGIGFESLPRVVFADAVQGFVTPAAARMLGVCAGTPVLGGFVDASAAVIQTPMRAGQLAHNAGSTDVLALCVDTPTPTEGILSRPVGVGAAFPEKWLAVRTIAAAGSAVDWARRVLFSELNERAWRRALTRACENTRDAGGVSCLPAFAGQRAAIEQQVGAMFGGVNLATRREDLLRAIIKGLELEGAYSHTMLSKLQRPEKVVYEMGGGSALRHAMHRLWPGKHEFRQLKGDSLRGLVELAAGSGATREIP